jgi:hypothetical protein
LAQKEKLRHDSGIFHGTYTAIESAVAQAFQDSPNPEPKRWDYSGRIGVQIQPGYELPNDDRDFEIRSSNIEIDPVASDQWETRSGRRHAFSRVRIRVASVGKRHEPVWVELPVVFHRRPPGTLKWAYIVVKRVGVRTLYQLQLTLISDKFDRELPKSGQCSINFGWRGMPDGTLRVAALKDSTGYEEELALDPDLRSSLSYPEELRSIGDGHFNCAVAEFRAWMKSYPQLVSDELREDTRYMHQWRSHKKLAKIAYRLKGETFQEQELEDLWVVWRTERKAAQKESERDLFASRVEIERWAAKQGVADPQRQIALYLEWWRRKNHHLYGWECDQRYKSLNQRREVYRLWVRSVCDRYREIRIEKFNMSKTAVRPPKGTERTRQEKLASHHRFLASPSVLRLCLLSAAATDQVHQLPAYDGTRRCQFCGVVSEIDAKSSVDTVCPVCHNEPIAGKGDDQDFRNAGNQLIREDWADDENRPKTKRAKKGRVS